MGQVENAPYTSTTAEPQWFYWNGDWGASDDEEFHSPSGPPRDAPEWEDLQEWAEEHEDDCEVEGGEFSLRAASGQESTKRKLPQPAPPSLNARRSGSNILLQYAVPSRGASAHYILLTVTSKAKLDATRSKKFALRSNHGASRLPLPLATGPYIATASTFTNRDERSGTKVVDVLP